MEEETAAGESTSRKSRGGEKKQSIYLCSPVDHRERGSQREPESQSAYAIEESGPSVEAKGTFSSNCVHQTTLV